MNNKPSHNRNCPAFPHSGGFTGAKKKGGKGGFPDDKGISDEPLLYYKTKEEIEACRKKPVKLKLQWLQAQMEFFHKAMPAKAKRIREKLRKGDIG
jgi:hypothetical protein